MKLQIEEKDGVVIMNLYGKLMGGPDSDLFKSAIRELMDKGEKRVIVSLKHVNWVNSTGIGILMTGYTTLRKAGGDLKLLHISDRIQSILYVTKLNLIFECFDNEAAAIRSYMDL